MPDTPSIVINKIFTYRGQPEEWSNRYHFVGSTPSSLAGWKDLALAIWAQERTFLNTTTKFNGFLGYVAGDETANAIMGPDDLTTAEKSAGVLSGSNVPGDTAAWVRWATGTRNSKGRPIYLRKYFHGVGTTGTDAIVGTAATAMAAYGTKMADGTLPGGFKIAAPQGAIGTTVKVPTYVTTRTLKRRGKDPS